MAKRPLAKALRSEGKPAPTGAAPTKRIVLRDPANPDSACPGSGRDLRGLSASGTDKCDRA
ncbi:hypothetical protein QUB05_31260 [Microcoleus sp. F10-C6]|uniref:hypothetical protein n=1 Tax=unclassified Microcoleus TaxID=2642155 RepID=UPI002FD2FBEC